MEKRPLNPRQNSSFSTSQMISSPLLVIPASPCWPCEPPASAVGRWDPPLGKPNSRKSHFGLQCCVAESQHVKWGKLFLLTLSTAERVGAGGSVERVKTPHELPHICRRGGEQHSAHPSSVRTSISVRDLIPPSMTCDEGETGSTSRGHKRVYTDRQRRQRSFRRLTSTTTTSTFTFGGKSSSGWNRFTMATSRWMVARRSLLWMTDRRAANNKIKAVKQPAWVLGQKCPPQCRGR